MSESLKIGQVHRKYSGTKEGWYGCTFVREQSSGQWVGRKRARVCKALWSMLRIRILLQVCTEGLQAGVQHDLTCIFKSFFLPVWRIDEKGLRGGIREIRKRHDGGLGRPIGEMERRISEVEYQNWLTN